MNERRFLTVLLFLTGIASLHAQEQPGEVVWKIGSNNKWYSTPCMTNNENQIISIDEKGDIYSINYKTGNIDWQSTVIIDGEYRPMSISYPAYDKDKNYFYFGDIGRNNKSYIYCFNADNGELVWKRNVNGVMYGSPALANGKVVVLVYDEVNPTSNRRATLFCLNQKSGQIEWFYKLDVSQIAPPFTNVAIGINNNIYITLNNYMLFSFNIKNGELNWKFTGKKIEEGKPNWVTSSPSITKNGDIVVGLDKLYLIKWKSGEPLWEFSAIDDEGLSEKGLSTASIGFGNVYINSESTKSLYCLDEFDGSIKWVFNHKQEYIAVSGITLGSNKEIYFVRGHPPEGGSLFCINGEDGSLLWEKMGFNGYSSPLLTKDGYLIYGNESSYNENGAPPKELICIRANSGLADTAWPIIRQNVYGTGMMDTSLKVIDHPKSQVVVEGSALQLQVEALGLGELKYQWKFNDKNLVEETFDKLSLFGVSADMAGEYSVSVSDDNSTVESEPAVVQVLFPPKVTKQPESQVALAGTTVRFSVEATGTPPLNYQWKFSGLPLGGSDGPTLELNNVKESFSGEFTVTITNELGEVTSEPAVLTVIKDSDLDGLSDVEEQALNSDPNNADTDSDGLKDGEEVRVHKTDPTIADTDQDGLLDGLEIRGGFDPTVATERQPGNLEIRVAVELKFFTLEWENYQLQSSLDLTSWENEGEPFNGVGGYSSIYQSARDSKIFWRLKLVN